MTSRIKAIETRYGGCRFRSRLEARWAVFFDALQIEWQYEPQGFNFDGDCYLPDFYLSQNGLYVEVKGSTDALSAASPTLRKFASSMGAPLLILCDVPKVTIQTESLPHHCCLVGSSVYGCFLCQTAPPHLKWMFHVGTEVTSGHVFTTAWSYGVRLCRAGVSAYEAARSARFEHGESGPAPDLRPVTHDVRPPDTPELVRSQIAALKLRIAEIEQVDHLSNELLVQRQLLMDDIEALQHYHDALVNETASCAI